MHAHRTFRRRLWWWVSGLGSAVTVAAAAVFLRGSPYGLDTADKLSSVGSLLVGTAALTMTGLSLRAATRPRRQEPAVPDVASTSMPAAPGAPRLWNVPPPVPTFVGRDTMLRHMALGPGRMVLYGPPGVGKSQLALAWAHLHAGEYEIGWRIGAGDAITATTDLAELADALGVGNEDAAKAAISAVTELGHRTNWLLIIDDAPGPAAIMGWLPHRGGRVLITSRSPSWESVGTAAEVLPFASDVAAGFLRDRARDNTPMVADELADLLGGLPLALEQAGAYCRQTGRSLASYLALYRAVGGGDLLEHGAPAGYAPGPVTVTVRLALRLVARQNPAAAQLLRLLAFLAPTGIPRDLPAAAPQVLPRPLRQTAADPVKLDQTVRTLIETALAAPDQPGQLRIHQLVQEIVRHPSVEPPWWRRAAYALRLPGVSHVSGWSTQRWTRAAIQLLMAALPSDPTNPSQWDRLTALTPHAQALILYADSHGTDATRLQTSMNALTQRLRDVGEIEGARQLVEQIVQVRRRFLGDEHPDTLASINDLAAILSAAGDLSGARQLVEQIVQVRRRLLGDEHPDTLASMNDLATILRRSGRPDVARRLVDQTLQVRRRLLGDEHPDTQTSMSDLAGVLSDLENVHVVFASVARRSRSLVERLIDRLDRLERSEEDPDRLAELFQLDHLATRMRRNEETLLMLAGAGAGALHSEPAAIVDVMRAAQSEIEFYPRVEFGVVDLDIAIRSTVVSDLVHLIAELLENATLFSPPDSSVVVGAWRTTGTEAVIRIQDQGIGFAPDQIDERNRQLADPPSIYDSPSDLSHRMGLYVVARLAARHGIRVQLFPHRSRGTSRDCGTVVAVVLPADVLEDNRGHTADRRSWASGPMP